MPEIADINDTEIWTARTTRRERYGEDREIELQIADSEIRLAPSDRELTACPARYRTEGGRHSVIFKAGERKYRSQFLYKPDHQFSTERREYDDLAECVVATLQAQADFEAQEAGEIKNTRR
jgi:hypothetical protein